MNISKEAVEAAAQALRDEGLDDVGNSPHGWRCEFPDLYPGYCTCVIDIARAALEAAWAVMHPVLTTVEELRAFPVGSVVRSHGGGVWVNDGDEDVEWWERPGTELGFDAADIPLPAKVIYRP